MTQSSPPNTGKAGKPRKFRNVPVEVDGIRFDSKKEARRWGELRLMERASLIADLKRQVRYRLDVNGLHVCDYIADFTYLEGSGAGLTVEDVKGVATDVFRLKAKLMKAIHGVEVKLS